MDEKKKPGRKPKTKKEVTEEAVEKAEEVIETTSEGETPVEIAEEPVMPVSSTEKPITPNLYKEESKPVDERDAAIERLEKIVADLQAQLAQRTPQVVQVMADTERVVMRFNAEVADDNLTVFGQDGMYGQVTGKTGTVTVPKSEWSRFYNESVRNMIARRWLIVLSGFDERERELYGCNYKSGEILDETAFHKLLDMGRDLISIFPVLCEEHQAMVASRFISAYGDGDERVNDRELVVALNEMSKETYRHLDRNDSRRKGLFYPIIEDMNDKEANS